MTAMRRERGRTAGGARTAAPRRGGETTREKSADKRDGGVSIWRATITYQTQTTCASSQTEGEEEERLTYY